MPNTTPKSQKSRPADSKQSPAPTTEPSKETGPSEPEAPSAQSQAEGYEARIAALNSHLDELEDQVERLELANVGFKESQDRMKNHLGDLVRSKVAHEGRTLFTLMAMLGCAKMTTKEARASGAFQTDTEFSRGVKALQGAGLAKKTRLNVVELEE